MKKTIFLLMVLLFTACNPPPVDNPYRKAGLFSDSLDVSVVFLELSGVVK